MQGATRAAPNTSPPIEGYGAAGGSMLLSGFISMEVARVDASIAAP